MLLIYMVSVTAEDTYRPSASKKVFFKTIQLARNVLIAASKVSSKSAAPCNEVWNNRNRTFGLTPVQLHVLSTIQQLHLYASVFQSVLASNQCAVVEDVRTTHSFVMITPCGPRNSWPHLAVSWEGHLCYRMPSKDSDLACNLLDIKWLQQRLSCPGLYHWRLKVRQWILNFIPRLAPAMKGIDAWKGYPANKFQCGQRNFRTSLKVRTSLKE